MITISDIVVAGATPGVKPALAFPVTLVGAYDDRLLSSAKVAGASPYFSIIGSGERTAIFHWARGLSSCRQGGQRGTVGFRWIDATEGDDRRLVVPTCMPMGAQRTAVLARRRPSLHQHSRLLD